MSVIAAMFAVTKVGLIHRAQFQAGINPENVKLMTMSSTFSSRSAWLTEESRSPKSISSKLQGNDADCAR